MRINFRRLIAAAIFCLACSHPAAAPRAEETGALSPHHLGNEYFFKGEYAKAITALAAVTTPGAPWVPAKPAIIPVTAQDYAAEAACLLGDLHALGLGTPRDMRAAGKWWFPPEKNHDALLAASEKGDPSAQEKLADLYLALPCAMNIDPERTDSISSSRPLTGKLALEWYGKAAAGGNAEAAIKAAKLVGEKFNTTPQEKQAIQNWCRIAANQGLQEGQHRYGLALRDAGEYAEGLRWIRMAEAQGYAPAKKYLEEGRTREIRESGRFEMIVVLAGMMGCLLAVFMLRKKQPLRAYLTRRNAVKTALYIGMLGFSMATIAATPELSRLFDRIFFFLMRARIYLPDSIADNMYIFVAAVLLAFIALILLVAQFKDIFFRSLMRAMDTEPGRSRPHDDKKPD